MRTLINYIRSCFCRHEWELIFNVDVIDDVGTYSCKTYRCTKCGYITIYIGYNFNRFIIEEYEVSSEWLEVYGELPVRFDEIPNDVIKKIEIER